MSILIIGHEGNMGKRYQAILNLMQVQHFGLDVKEGRAPTREELRKAALNSQGIIIASPTDAHAAQICTLADYDLPILCEKPLAKDPRLLELIFDECEKNQTNLSMIFQYQCLVENQPQTGTETHYNYFKHGSDGLAWDCIQILGLHKGSIKDVRLEETSPVWDCMINGHRLSTGMDMDMAYLLFVKNWLTDPGQDLDFVRKAHDRVFEYQKENKKHGRYH